MTSHLTPLLQLRPMLDELSRLLPRPDAATGAGGMAAVSDLLASIRQLVATGVG